ncbi:MAG: zinc finger domain-containing protein [Candidatus Thermoplasmatota archaeon]|nr:zinc finger domain-containing protein [Candidatus Thermoplasmatota archaeon]MCL5930824.1 zinc finger domain-containing protein [Candidatus Thermoplasmatota archaeon]
MEVNALEFCTSCGTGLQERGATTFKCPSCGQETISRCNNCRELSVTYQCPKCGFRGP